MDVGSAFAESTLNEEISVKKPRARSPRFSPAIPHRLSDSLAFSSLPLFLDLSLLFLPPVRRRPPSLLLPVLPISPPFCLNFFRRPLSQPVSRFSSALSFILRCFRFLCFFLFPPFVSPLFVVSSFSPRHSGGR